MSKDIPRCPHCAGVVVVKDGLWERLWPLGKKETYCKTCMKKVANAHALIMGEAFGNWVREFQGRLSRSVEHLPVLEINAALKAIKPGLGLEEVRRVASVESLAHFAATVFRPVLKDQAQGRNADLTVVVLKEGNAPVAVGILGRTSAETGEKETELIFARVGPEMFFAYLPPQPTRRIKDAIRMEQMAAAITVTAGRSSVMPAM